jgi:predicted anti-sigma-YlaC factor YlaD
VRPAEPLLRAVLALALAGAAAGVSGCSISRMATKSVANSLTAGPDVYSTDDDPELVADALPFGLKTMEGLLATLPDHEGLLQSLTRGFTLYGAGFVEPEAAKVEATDWARAEEIRARSLRLYLRARGYGLRGLEQRYPGISQQLPLDPVPAAARIQKRDVAMLYWTAAAWGSAVSVGKDRPELIAEVPTVRALMERGLALDETFQDGAFHEALMVLDGLSPALGGSPERVRKHFERAVELQKGRSPSPYITLAQTVAVPAQDRAEFVRLLETALAIPPADSTYRLANTIHQRRARELLARQDELFLDDAPDTTHTGE